MIAIERLKQSMQALQSCVCVGLDTDMTKIPEILRQEQNPIHRFNREIIMATRIHTVAYKLNLAFYLAAGKTGYEALWRTIEDIPSDAMVILDCKIGDIGNTMDQYLKGFFEGTRIDAITANPLMGKDIFNSFDKYPGKMAFVLVMTSNPGAGDFLKYQYLYREIACWVGRCNPETAGAVVGATHPTLLWELRRLMRNTLFLIPGVGAQGGEIATVVEKVANSMSDPGFIINASRSILYASGGADFADAAGKAAEALKSEIREALARRFSE